MKKWAFLNPEEKLNSFTGPVYTWIRCIAIIILFVKVDFAIAILFTGLILMEQYFGYKRLEKKALAFKKGNGLAKPEEKLDVYTVFSWLWNFGIIVLALLIFGD